MKQIFGRATLPFTRLVGIILGILIADTILELFRTNLGIIENNASIIKSYTHLSNSMETK